MEIEEFTKIKAIVDAVKDLKLSPNVDITDYADYSVKFEFKRPTKK